MRNIPILEILLANAGANEDVENIQKKIKGTCIHVYMEKEKTKVFMIFPGEGNSYPLQYYGLENSMDCISP